MACVSTFVRDLESPISHFDCLNGKLERISPIDVERLAPEWRALSHSGPCAEPFFQPEWFAAYMDAFLPDGQAVLVTVRAGSVLKGALPLKRTRRFFKKIPAATLRSLSSLHSCRFDLVHAGEVSAVTREVWNVLKADSSWDVIEALDVPKSAAFEELLVRAEADGFFVGTWPTRKMPFLPLAGAGAPPLLNCPESYKSFRSRLKSKQKKLAAEGEVNFSVETEASPATLQKFFALEGSGWKGQNASAIISKPELVAFYTSAAQSAARHGHLRIYTLAVDGGPIAMQFGFFMNDTYFAPKVAYDEKFGKFSPGQLLVNHVITDLTNLQAKRYEFLGPRAPWKSVWTDSVREHSNCYIFRPTLKGWGLYLLTMKLARLVRLAKCRIWGDPQEKTA